MGSRPTRDDGSPAATSSLLPQLRGSRRGSVASTSSTTQLDKETLSQALDQIHNTASQSESLTTFNEYTSPPSSSSGPDSRSIASEIQGGLSGIYTKFRASVGNVKVIINAAGEDVAGEARTAKQTGAAVRNPAMSIGSASESSRSSFTANASNSPALGSECRSPNDAKSCDAFQVGGNGNTKPSRASTRGTSVSSKSLSGSLATLKSPPVNLTQASLPTSISPTLAEINISALKQPWPPGINANDDGPSTDVGRDVYSPTPDNDASARSITIKPHNASPELQSSDPRPTPTAKSRISKWDDKSSSSASVHQEKLPPDSEAAEVNIKAAQEDAQLLASNEVRNHLGPPSSSSIAGNVVDGGASQAVATNPNKQDDIFQLAHRSNGEPLSATSEPRTNYQHIELPIRKALAALPVAKPGSSISSLSRAPSSNADTDAVVESPKRSTDPYPEKYNVLHSASSASLQSRELHAVRVPSQAKNKVLDKQYWMKDENAKDCFYCGDPFSTFRRKHHCSK